MAKKLKKDTSIAKVKNLKSQVTRKFEQGGPGKPPATFQDSLDVANSAQQVADWYKSQGYYGGVNVGGEVPARSRDGVRMISMDRARGAANKPISKTPITIGGRTTIGQKDDLGNGGLTLDLPEFEVTLPSVSSIGEVGAMALAGTLNAVGGIQNLTNESLAEWESPYRFRQYADDHKRIQNTDAPKALYDTRIHPRSTFNLQGTAPGYFSGNADIVDMPLYEKWYAAPWSVLSPEDKRKRIEFGILDGTPFKDFNDERLIQQYPDLAIARGGRRQYDAETIKNAAASGYAPTQEGAAQYERNKWGKNPRVYDAETIKNAAKSGYPATQSGAAEYEANGWTSKPVTTKPKKAPNADTDVAYYMREVEGRDGSETTYANRKKIAEELGIKNYSGTAAQNIELIKKLKEQKNSKDAPATADKAQEKPEEKPETPKQDSSRRKYPIKFTGDAATDKMIMQLYGPQGTFTDNGYIPLDDPKYNPYVGGIGPRTPEQEMKRIAVPPGGFEKGGFNYTKNMLNANSTSGPRSEESWQDPGVNKFSGNTNGVNADYYFEKGGLKNQVIKKFRAAGFETDPPKKEPAKEEDVQMREDYAAAMAALEAQRESYAKRLADEQARVKKVRGNVIPAAYALDRADSNLSQASLDAFKRSVNAKTPEELAAAKKDYPQELKNVLPTGGRYNLADWDESTGNWKPGKTPGRELYCTPYGCFTYQKAGATDVPNIEGNFGFTGGVEKGTLPFKKVSDKEAEPGDMAIVYGEAPLDYTNRNAGYGVRPHHTTVLSDKNPIVRDDKGNIEGINMFNANDGRRLNYKQAYYPVEDHFGFYRYVGQLPKLEKEGAGFPSREKEIENAYNARHAAWLAQQPIPEMMAMKEPTLLPTQGMPMVTSQLQKSSFPSFEQPNKKVKRTKIKI